MTSEERAERRAERAKLLAEWKAFQERSWKAWVKSKRRLYCIIPASDSTSMYRGMGPLARLREQLPDLELMVTNKHDWSTIAMADAVFMQRPSRAGDLQIAQMAKAQGKPLWVDYDDDLFIVPKWNPAYSIYGKDDTKRIVATIIAMADVVTVSTQQIAENFSKGKGLNKNIVVVPNAFNEQMFPYRERTPKSGPERNPIALWRGTATHDKDLHSVGDQLSWLARDFPKVSFTFMGSPFWLTIEGMRPENTLVAEAVDPVEYFEVIHEIKPRVMMVPLEDDPFNRCKSNIAWIEATFAGAVTVAPDWPEWRRPGVITYNGEEDFYNSVSAVLENRLDCRHAVGQSWQHIRENLLLGQVNELRAKVIMDLMR